MEEVRKKLFQIIFFQFTNVAIAAMSIANSVAEIVAQVADQQNPGKLEKYMQDK